MPIQFRKRYNLQWLGKEKLTEVVADKDDKQLNNSQGLLEASFPFQECPWLRSGTFRPNLSCVTWIMVQAYIMHAVAKPRFSMRRMMVITNSLQIYFQSSY